MCLPACLRRLLDFRAAARDPLPFAPARIVPPDGPGSPAPTPAPALPAFDPAHLARARVVDLTHTLDPDFPTFDGRSPIDTRTLATHAESGWFFREWRVHEHSGTHLDAPLHRNSGLASADLIPASTLVGPLVVVDVRARAARQADTELTPDDLRAWESRHGPIPAGAVVAMNSGWSAHARSPRFRGVDSRGVLHFPGVHPESAAFLLAERQVHGLMVDTLSLDPGPSVEFPTHTRWLGAGRWGLECAAGLDDVPASGALVMVGVPKVAGASGGPARVLALVPA